ncbi:MAG: BON domain-containing protein [Neisseriaceae bacterium]|nr:MAG: BON domain-containing protein [Neisseriaceae bacterium]
MKISKIVINLGLIVVCGQLLFSLTGCANAALAVTDPRSLSTVTSDQYITRDLSIKYMGSEFESDHVSATVYNHEVLLTGQASSLAQRIKIVRTAKEFDSVQKVYDYVEISSKYVSTSSEDTYITGKVKSSLFGSGDINSNDVKIVTDKGVVYILGLIAKSQLENMINVTKSIDGVKKVVPLVHYKDSDSKLNLF